MTLSMYQASAPVFTRMLGNLKACLQKAEADAQARGVDPATLIESRLAPDMHPLPRQVQIACDMAKRCAGKLAGVEPPPFADTEASFAELYQRIDKTVAFIDTLTAGQIDGSEERDVTMTVPGREMHFTGQQFLLYVALPNFYFHVTTAYAILRHGGAPVGKMDYLGGL